MNLKVVSFCRDLSRKRLFARDREIALNGRDTERTQAQGYWAPVPLSPGDRIALAMLGAFVVALFVGLVFGAPPEIHP